MGLAGAKGNPTRDTSLNVGFTYSTWYPSWEWQDPTSDPMPQVGSCHSQMGFHIGHNNKIKLLFLGLKPFKYSYR